MRRIINEGFDYHDLVDQVNPIIAIDKYVAKMGGDDDIVTLAFSVKGQQACEDLAEWFEKGYDFVLDAQVSDGELSSGRYLVFVEMDRRSTVPARIIEMIEDLETLSGLPLSEWTVMIEDEEYEADVDVLGQKLILSPHLYRQEKETDLNEMRNLSGLEPRKIHGAPDSLLKAFLSKAGL
jgi:hypothetical protein